MVNVIEKKFKKKLTGTVVSDKASKTIVVKVVRRFKDSKYGKFVHETKKYYAHDEKTESHTGDRVVIIESRPRSRLKRWDLFKVIK